MQHKKMYFSKYSLKILRPSCYTNVAADLIVPPRLLVLSHVDLILGYGR